MDLHAIGITAEYNPFHNGHQWQLQALRERLGNIPVIACMSGWFVQRGEIALASPWTRAAMAVHAGVDLVLLLPSWYSLRSADYFAAGAVKSLAATGIVNMLACGVEYINTGTSTLPDTADWTLQQETEQQVKTLLQQGLSYGAAWETAAMQNNKDVNWFKGANNLLALAYQKAILQNDLPIKLLTLSRRGNGYNDTGLMPPFASATAIRTALRKNSSDATLSAVLPKTSLHLLSLKEINYPERFTRQEDILSILLAHLLIQHDSNSLYEHSSASRDLCDRFYNAREELQQGYTAFCKKITNNRDALPSVRRLTLQLLLQKPRAFWKEIPEPSYLRVLAFNDRGRSLLKKMKGTATLPIINKLGNETQYKNSDLYPLLQLDAAAADLFQLLNRNAGGYGSCFTTSPLYVELNLHCSGLFRKIFPNNLQQ